MHIMGQMRICVWQIRIGPYHNRCRQ